MGKMPYPTRQHSTTPCGPSKSKKASCALLMGLKGSCGSKNTLIRFHQSIQNQTVKRIISRQKQPSQVQQALATIGDFPAETLEPGEFIRDRSGVTAADGRLKAADFINNPARIGKGVNMGAVDNDSVGWTGDRLKALCAANILVFLHNRFFRNGFLGCGSAFVLARITKEYRSRGYHVTHVSHINYPLYRCGASSGYTRDGKIS